MNTSGWFQLAIVIIFLSLSGIGWLLRQLQEQAAIKRQRDEARRRELERLRTGRTGEDDDEPARPLTLEERIAEARERRLEELRRRQAAEQGQVVLTQGGTQTTPRQTPRVPQPRPAQVPQRPPATQRNPVPQHTPTPQRPMQPPRTIQTQTQPESQRAQSTRDRLIERQRELIERAQRGAAQQAQAAAARGANERQRQAPQAGRANRPARDSFPKAGVRTRTPLLGHITHNDLRRAIVMSELLQPPVSMRPPGSVGRQFPG